MPVTESVTRKEDTNEHTNGRDQVTHPRQKAAEVVKPEDVEQQTWDDWLALRRKQRAPVTQTALDRLAAEAGKAGMALQDVLATCCANGWRGFSAAWLQGRRGAHAAAAPQKSFAQQDREAGWARWEEMTGRQHPERLAYEGASAGLVVDVQARPACPLEIAP